MEKLLQIKIDERAIVELDRKCKEYGLNRRSLLELFIKKGKLFVEMDDYKAPEELVTPVGRNAAWGARGVLSENTEEDEWAGIDEEKAARMKIANMSPMERLQLAKENFAGHYDFEVGSLMKPQIEFIKQHLDSIANDTYEYPD